jgi:hypothetical protein
MKVVFAFTESYNVWWFVCQFVKMRSAADPMHHHILFRLCLRDRLRSISSNSSLERADPMQNGWLLEASVRSHPVRVTLGFGSTLFLSPSQTPQSINDQALTTEL